MNTRIDTLARLSHKSTRRSAIGAIAAFGIAVKKVLATGGSSTTIDCSGSLEAQITTICSGNQTKKKGRRRSRNSTKHRPRRDVTRKRRRRTKDTTSWYAKCVTDITAVWNEVCEVDEPGDGNDEVCEDYSGPQQCVPVGEHANQTNDCCSQTRDGNGRCAFGNEGQRCNGGHDCPVGRCCQHTAQSKEVHNGDWGFCLSA